MKFNFKHIVSKILVVCTILVGFAVYAPQLVFAADVDTKHNYRIDIAEDTSFVVEHKITLTSRDKGALIQKYSIEVPFTEIVILGVKDSGRSAKYKFKGNKFTIDLRNGPLRKNQSTTFLLRYKVTNEISKENGLLSLFIPEIKGKENISNYVVTINYPVSFPDLVYKPRLNTRVDNTTVTVNDSAGIKLIWGNQWGLVINDNSNQTANKKDGARRMMNVVPNILGQTVKFEKLETKELFSENNGNLWLNSAEEFEYSAYVSKIPSSYEDKDFVGYEYVTLPIPPSIRNQVVNFPRQYGAVEMIYNYMVENYRINYSDLENRSGLDNIKVKLDNVEQYTINSLEYVYALAGYLNSIGIEHRLVYGYFYGVAWPSFNEQLPHVWMEAKLDDRVILLDPFMQSLTGLDFFAMPDVGRIAFGIWDPQLQADNLLGLIGPGLKLRPEAKVPANVLGTDESGQLQNVVVTIEQPTSVGAGESYSVNLNITNKSPEVLKLGSLFWDNIDITSAVIKINDRLSFAVAPGQTLSLKVSDLVLPQLFYDGEVRHKFTLSPASPGFETTIAEYIILYVPSAKFMFGVGLIIVLAIILLASVLRRWSYRERLIMNDLPYN